MAKYLDDSGLSYLWSKLKALFANKADSAADGIAIQSAGILFGQVDSTSTSTVFTAQIDGVTEYYNGLTIMLRNATVTSASGFTLDINGLGAKPVYSNMGTGNPITPTNPTRETTIFNINYTLIFVYSETLVDGGAWINYRGYYSDANSIGYQIRTNSSTRPTTDKFYRYRILFESADGKKWIPSNTSTSTNATAARAVNQRPINPWGDIVYYGTTSAIEANANVTPAQLWQQYALTFGYSFNRTGAALVLPYPSPIYIKCAPQSDGSAIIDADTPYVTSLPNTEDGKIYIYLGRSYSATAVELVFHHPVYYYKDGAIREWTNAAASGGGAVTSVNGQTGTVVLDAEDVGALPDTTTIPTKTSDLTNDSGFVTSSGVTSVTINTSAEPYDLPITNGNAKLDIGDGLSASDASNKVTLTHKTGAGWNHIPSGGSSGQFLGYSSSGTASWQTPPTPTVPTKTSDLTNDSGFITSAQAPVQSVNGQTGTVSITIPTVPSASTTTPSMDGTASYGSGTTWARADHVHPTDTSRQATLVSGTNIKTINNESILGSGNITIQGGSAEALTDAEIEAAVDSQFMTVTVSLTNPLNPSDFSSFKVYIVSQEYDNYWDAYANKGAEIASIDSPTGSTQFTWDSSNYGIITKASGSSYVAGGNVSTTGGVTLIESDYEGGEFFAVTGEGSITIDGIDYDD